MGNTAGERPPKRAAPSLEAVLARYGKDPLAEGYDDAVRGVPRTGNPYPDTEKRREDRHEWFEGWQAGVEDLIKKRKAS